LKVADREPAPEWLLRAFREGGKKEATSRAKVKRELDAQIAKATVPIRARAVSLRANIECDELGKGESCLQFLEAAVLARRAARQLQGEVDDATVLAQELIKRHRFGAARKVLASLELPEGAPAEALYYLAFGRGLLARRNGDHRTALEELRIAAQLGRWFNRRLWLQAEEERALELSQLGRFEEANATFGLLLPGAAEVLSPCELADLSTNYGWALAAAREVDEPLGDPVPLFESASRIFSSSDCPDAQEKRFNAALNLARAYLQKEPSSLPLARAALRDAEPLLQAATLRERLWWFNVNGRLALAEARPEEALAEFEHLENLARALLSNEELWRAAYRKAGALVALRRPEEAVATLQAADVLVDQQLATIPLDAGKESFADQWEAGTRLLVDQLLKLDRPGEALKASRVARARVLRQLAVSQHLASLSPTERQRRDTALDQYLKMRDEIDVEAAKDWQRTEAELTRAQEVRAEQYRNSLAFLDRELAAVSVPGDAKGLSGLPPPRKTELILAYFPLSEPGRWVGFTSDGAQVTYHRFSLPGGGLEAIGRRDLASMLLEPFGPEIRKARRLRILPYGKLRTVPFHALPFDGDALLAAKPVAYGLDLVLPPSAVRNRELRALVVFDPLGNLAEARKEGPNVVRALGRSGRSWQIRTLSGPQATKSALLQQLRSGIDLLHYAGHADFSGRGGWESHLPLAGGSRLTLADIVSLEPAPTWVVLSGCESGQTDETTQVESQGLAQAFLLAGSQGVVAATRKIEDRSAHQLINALYGQVRSAPLDLAVLLQRAQLDARQRFPLRQWESFRAFLP
jgi:tetratricopeptide (TPR) repeat protein